MQAHALVRARTTSPKNRLYMHRPTFWNRRIIRRASRTVIHLSLSRSRVLDHCQLPSIEPKREPHSSLLIQRVTLCLSTFCFPTFCFSALFPSFFFYQFFRSPECFFPVVLFLLFFLIAFEMEFVQRSENSEYSVRWKRKIRIIVYARTMDFCDVLNTLYTTLLVEIKITDENK